MGHACLRVAGNTGPRLQQSLLPHYLLVTPITLARPQIMVETIYCPREKILIFAVDKLEIRMVK